LGLDARPAINCISADGSTPSRLNPLVYGGDESFPARVPRYRRKRGVVCTIPRFPC
jgi:hypothetical protein